MIRRWFTILLFAGVVGCGPKMPPVANADLAREALQVALQSWKQGDKTESLQERSPPIYFNDEFRRDGQQLVDFEIGNGDRNGMGWRCGAALTLKQLNGPQTQRKVEYQIDTDPAIVIVQQP